VNIVFCMDCNHPIKLESRPKVGDTITCSGCGAELEIINVEPVELDWAYLEPVADDDDWL